VFNSEDRIEAILPHSGWLGDYLRFTEGLEACPRFRFFTACCTLGAAINNRVYIYRGDEELLPKLFPNLWIILLAPPGRGHKTSTINMAVNCLQAARPDVRMIADKITPESLVQALSAPVTDKEILRIGPRDATGLIKAPELSVFFGKQQYNTGLVSLITDLYDYREEWSSETIMRGKNVLKHICISIMGGSTPDWLQKMLPEDAFTGGFMSRFVICEMPPNYLKRIAYPIKLEGRAWDKVVEHLSYLSDQEGEMGWTPDCAQYYKEYYEGMIPTGEVQKDAYREREPEQILRLSMLLALSEKRMHIEKADFLKSQEIFTTLMSETDPRIERLTTNPRMSLTQDIQCLLKQFGSLSEEELMQKTYRSLTLGEGQFFEALRVLKMAKVIEMGLVKGRKVVKLVGEMEESDVDKKTTKGTTRPSNK
jgi:hypothetical protein